MDSRLLDKSIAAFNVSHASRRRERVKRVDGFRSDLDEDVMDVSVHKVNDD